MTNRTFWLIDTNGDTCVMDFHSRTPRDAALKAATRGHQQICLADIGSGKLHIFKGECVALTQGEANEFTRSRNIQSKPVVRKMAYRNLHQSLAKSDIPVVCTELRGMME